MGSLILWKSAKRPNYETNVNLRFPYSEVTWLGKFYVLKIPVALNDMIDHVDYWGEGKIVSDEKIRGFSNCYNVNHQYQLVSSGPDLGKKIPNRIPVRSDNDCDTSGYIKDNSVLIVTVAGARVTSSCAKDIVRVINSDHGKVIVYVMRCECLDLSEFNADLGKKGLILRPNANASPELVLTYYEEHFVFETANDILREMQSYIDEGKYDTVLDMAQSLKDLKAEAHQFDTDWIAKIFSKTPEKVMSFVYKLWNGGARNILNDLLPESLQHIFNEDAVTIVNKQYQQPLKLGMSMKKEFNYNRLVWGDKEQYLKTSEIVSWKVLPVWGSDGVTFKLYNIYCRMYMELDVNKNNNGDRKAWGSLSSNEDSQRFYLKPLIKDGSAVFIITNVEFGQGLKLDVEEDHVGDRQVWGHNGSVNNEEDRFGWVIKAWSDGETSKTC